METGAVEMVKGMKLSTSTSTSAFSLPLPDSGGFGKDKKDGTVSELIEAIKTSSAAMAAVIGAGNRMKVKYVHLLAIQMMFISKVWFNKFCSCSCSCSCSSNNNSSNNYIIFSLID